MVFANIMGFAGPEVFVIAGVVVLLFGGSKLAGFGKSLGDGMKEFKKASKEMHDDPATEAAPQPVVHPSGQLMMEDVRKSADTGVTPQTADAANAAGTTATKE